MTAFVSANWQIITVMLILVLCAGCAHYVLHPGAPNKTTSVAYDTLLSAKAAIDEAKVQIASGKLPVTAKAPLDVLIASYNSATLSLKAYSDAITTNVSSSGQLQQLTADLQQVELSLLAFKKAR